MNATNWKFLPWSGGLLDQPEAPWEDIMTIQATYEKLSKDHDG